MKLNIPANATEDELNIMLQVKRAIKQSILDCKLLYTNYRNISVCTMESDLKW